MAIKIKFDKTHNVISPTLVLATRSGRKLGAITYCNLTLKDSMNECSELSFKVSESDCSSLEFWNNITDFKLLWSKDWNRWFEIYVEVEESNDKIKNITAKSLGEAELSQINLYDIEINTENDIKRDNYEPTVLFNAFNTNASLLSRITEKIPHYKINHVDSSIANIQRTFSFDGKSIYDSFQEIAEEIDCLFCFDCYSDENGNIVREINVYDLESYCLDCGERGSFLKKCSKCGSTNIDTGYGEDTTIFISTDNLADSITYTTDNGSVKNCFKLEAGDDLMTATITNCNPNGSGYIWYISNETKKDMSSELVSKLDEYDNLYNTYQTEYQVSIPTSLKNIYNTVIDKYSVFSTDYSSIGDVVGYSSLMEVYYNVIDFYFYLNNSLMPNIEMSDTNAQKEIEKLVTANLSPVSVQNLSICSSATADSAVLSMAKVLVDNRYKVEISNTSFSNNTWSGIFTVINYSDETDTATSLSTVTCTINDDYENFTKQKIDKALKKNITNVKNTDLIQLFDLSLESYKSEIKKYSLSRLTSFHDSCQACIDILIEQGIANKQTWASKNPDLYSEMYIPYRQKLSATENEIKLRESEISIINNVIDILDSEKNKIQDILDFQKYLGEDLWLEFSAYRREDTYKNDNYISDGLNNSELFKNALDFIKVAKKDIYKSATLQHSISATLKNLLVIKEFEPIVDYFETGNWLRIKVNNVVYRLRLVDYQIEFDDLDNIDITFSDVVQSVDGISDVESILNKASSMATSYGSVSRQANKGDECNKTVNGWVENGLDATNTKIIGGADSQTQTWDSHGMLFRKYDSITDSYDDTQLKILNSTISITNDNWDTVKTAVGGYYYFSPDTGNLTYGYGVNAETLVGKMILGEQLGIYNESGTLKFDKNGFSVSNSTNTFTVNPNSSSIVTITSGSSRIFNLDSNGKLSISGKITADSGSIANWKIDGDTLVSNDGTMKLDSKNNTLDIYDNNDKLMTVNSGGIRFWRNSLEIGKIGITGGGNGSTYGLTFNLIDGDAMTWSVYDKENKVYINKLRYTESDGLKVHNNFWCKQFFGHDVIDIDLGNGKHAWGYIE